MEPKLKISDNTERQSKIYTFLELHFYDMMDMPCCLANSLTERHHTIYVPAQSGHGNVES